MSPSRVFIERPIATALLMAAVLIAGAVAYTQLPVAALPQVDYPTIQVLTFYPGASPDVMATTVTAPLERQFGQMQGLNQMTSTSAGAISVIVLQFALTLDLDVAEQEVQAAINAAQGYLPADLPTPPVYSKTNPADAPVLTLAITSDSLPLSAVEDLVDTRLAPKLSQLSGVGLVSISGGHKPAVRIQANPVALSAYGITLEALRTAVTAASVNTAKGTLDGARQAYQINANDQLTTSDDYHDVVVAYRDGSPVFLKDVATIADGVENTRQAAWMNQVPAIILNIQRQPGANTINVVNSIKRVLPQIEANLPASVQVTTLTDLTTSIAASVRDVQFELILTIALVVLVIFLFLRSVSATVIPSVAVPLSLVGTFAAMYSLGYSLDNLSLMALTISTGFVVDDAIVMIENISRYIEQGEPPMQAALKGAEQIGFTILSLTVSLIAVLIPLLFMGDIVGRLFREFAVTLAITIAVSAVVSLTLTPMMCARILRRRQDEKERRVFRASERAFERTIAFYGKTLRVVLKYQTVTLVVAVATLAVTVAAYVWIPKGFFPVQDTGVIQGISQAPASISFEAMAAKQQELANVILKDPAVKSLSSFIGADGINTTLNSGRILINLKDLSDRDLRAADVIRRLQAKITEVPGIALYMQPVQAITVDDRMTRTQYQYSLEASDPDELAVWSAKLFDSMKQLPQLEDVATDQQPGGRAVSLVIDRVTASRFGITPQTIDDTLYDAFGQRQINTMYTQLNQYHVILEAQPQFRADRADLADVYLPINTGGAPVPLSAFTRVEDTVAPLAITRQGQFPAVTVSFNLSPSASLSEAMSGIDRAVAGLQMPATIQGSFQGSAAAFRNSLSNQPLLILAALVTVYIVLGVLYESFVHPITILSTLPSAGAGALLALMVSGHDLDVIGIIGIILLIGIVKKNGIMMVDFALEAQRRDGKSAHDAIYEASLLRFRPIMMTTMAALLGGIPLALGHGFGSELRNPLGITIVGGLLVSQVLTLYTTPVIYVFFDRLAKRARQGARA